MFLIAIWQKHTKKWMWCQVGVFSHVEMANIQDKCKCQLQLAWQHIKSNCQVSLCQKIKPRHGGTFTLHFTQGVYTTSSICTADIWGEIPTTVKLPLIYLTVSSGLRHTSSHTSRGLDTCEKVLSFFLSLSLFQVSSFCQTHFSSHLPNPNSKMLCDAMCMSLLFPHLPYQFLPECDLSVSLILRLYLFSFPPFPPNPQRFSVCCTSLFFSMCEYRPSLWQQEGSKKSKQRCSSLLPSILPAHSS